MTLLCLVFGEAADFPANRSELYKEGLDVLLKKWDAKRNIERDQVYKKLSLKRKEDLLSQLAFSTFTQGDYFFKQQVAERYILDYIRNLPGANEDEDALQLDSEAVLKSIEAQHSLLVERARHVYSFSHVTFQEYFTAKQITRPTNQLSQSLASLAEHITEKRYREVLRLAVGILPNADDLLIQMKQQTDALVADEHNLQLLLSWAEKKSTAVEATYEIASIRAFYLSLSRAFSLAFNGTLDLDLSLDFSRALDLSLGLSSVLDLPHALNLYRTLELSLDLDLSRALELSCTLFISSRNLAPSRDLDLNLSHCLDRARAFDLSRALAAEQAPGSEPELRLKIDALRAQLPDPKDFDFFKQWWAEQGEDWTSQLRQVMIEHRNIGHDWQFTEVQKEKLQQYYDVNKLLVDCLNSDCYVTKATRQYIENTLLLPMSEIQKHPFPKQG